MQYRLRHVVKWLLALGCRLTGLLWLWEQRSAQQIRILLYHHVRPMYRDDGMTVSAGVFQRQLHVLTRRYAVVGLDHLSEVLRGRRKRALKTAILTFDDGHRDNYALAFPELKRRAMPATIFLAVGLIDNGSALWTEELRDAICETELNELDLGSMGLGRWALKSENERLRCVIELKNHLKQLPDKERNRLLPEILGTVGWQRQGNSNAMLTWDMAREMKKAGITFGAHTVTHRILTQIDAQEARREIQESKRRIEEQLGEPVKHFAYPNGKPADWNEPIRQYVRLAGYDTSCTTVKGLNSLNSDPYTLRRIEVTDTGCTNPFGQFSPAMFRAQLVGLLQQWERHAN